MDPMSVSSRVLRFVPRPTMDPFGASRSIYCLSIAGRPLHQHFVDAFALATRCADPILWIDEPALQQDQDAMAQLGERGQVVVTADDAAASQAVPRRRSRYPAATRCDSTIHGTCWRLRAPCCRQCRREFRRTR